MKKGKKSYTFFIWLSIWILLGLLLVIHKRIKEPFQVSQSIPNIWWTYWNDYTIPEVVENCIQSWRKWYPEMEIRIVTPKTLKFYVDIDPKQLSWNDNPGRESDIVRLNLLQKYGGYWSDATNYVTGRVEFPKGPYTEFVGYFIQRSTLNSKYPVIESWFFGTIPEAPFITRWRDVFMSISDHKTVDSYLQSMREKGVDFQGILFPGYLAIHVAAQYILQKEMSPEEQVEKLSLLKAEDGPFAYLAANDWDSQRALDNLCKGNHRTAMIKFCGAERKMLEKNEQLRKCIFKD